MDVGPQRVADIGLRASVERTEDVSASMRSLFGVSDEWH